MMMMDYDDGDDDGDDDDDDDDDDIYYDAVSVCLCATKNHHFLPTSELSAGGRKWAAR